MTDLANPSERDARLRAGLVLGVTEDSCDVLVAGTRVTARFAPQFPTPHVERVSPANVVAVASASDGVDVVLWRWYDAVVVDHADNGDVRLWEPAHGEVVARPRPSYAPVPIGARAYASAGLPGADWWVTSAVDATSDPVVELDEVSALYADNGLWESALAPPEAGATP